MPWVVFPEQRALAAALLCAPSGSPDGQSDRKGKMASGASNPNARLLELLSESDLSAGMWEHTSLKGAWKHVESTGVSDCDYIHKGGPLQ